MTEKEKTKNINNPTLMAELNAANKVAADANAKKAFIYKAVGVTALATTAYSVYKIGSLADKIPNERVYVITGIVGGAVFGALGLGFGSLSASAPSKKQETIGMVGLSTLVTTLGYSISRGVFKQTPKNSLIAGLVLLGGAYIWYKSNQTPVDNGKYARPIQAQPITNPPVGGGEQTVKTNMTGTDGFFSTEKQKVNY